MTKFTQNDLKKLWMPRENSTGEDNGQVTIIGGSSLFHGAPLMAIKAASRMVDMVFFSSPEKELEQISAKAGLSSFIWVPWEEVETYIKKSEAVLIGPGLMRYHTEDSGSEVFDEAGTLTRSVTKYLLQKYPNKKWVIDGGSLQVMDPKWIPKNAILTPNKKEYEMVFSTSPLTPLHNYGEGNQRGEVVEDMARKYQCVICDKGPTSFVTDGQITYEIYGGNAGLTKGGTGDTLAGMTVGFLAKNEPILAAAAASLVVKKTAERLYEKVGFNFNADDVANTVFSVLCEMTTS
jgi:hydroxyethylthiazole kinase-like uncharacterized protein yjeF